MSILIKFRYLVNSFMLKPCGFQTNSVLKRSIGLGLSNLSTGKRLFLIGATTFGITAGGNLFYQEWKLKKAQQNSIRAQLQWDAQKREFVPPGEVAKKPVPVDKVQELLVAKNVLGPTILPGNVKLTLLQYATCPFCCKVRAFLDYYGIPYDIVEVNPVLRTQLKISDYKKVPILFLTKKSSSRSGTSDDGGHGHEDKELSDRFIDEPIQLTDSSLIISILSSYFTCNPELKDNVNYVSTMYPLISFASLEDNTSTSEVVNKYFLMKGDSINESNYKVQVSQLSEERKWREWTDRVLVHTLSPNIYRTMEESIDSFKTFSNVGDWETLFPTWERWLVIYAGAMAMYLVGKRLTKRHNLKSDVRQSLFDCCNQWMRAVGKGNKFKGGQSPDLSDLSVYGVLNSIEGTIAFSDLIQSNPRLYKWYMDMKESCSMKRGHGLIAPVLKSLN